MSIDDVINVEMLSHPYNWIIVVLMLAIASFALCLLASPLGSIRGLTKVF